MSNSEATISTNSLTFSTGNWSAEQTFVVTGADDSVIDGAKSFNIELSTTYIDSSPQIISMSNYDNETREIIVSKNAVSTTEAGATDTFTVALSQQPSSAVTIQISVLNTSLSPSTSEATVSPTSLTFSTSNYSVAQPVVVTGVDDTYDDGDQNYYIKISGSGDYSSSLLDERISGSNIDND